MGLADKKDLETSDRSDHRINDLVGASAGDCPVSKSP